MSTQTCGRRPTGNGQDLGHHLVKGRSNTCSKRHRHRANVQRCIIDRSRLLIVAETDFGTSAENRTRRMTPRHSSSISMALKAPIRPRFRQRKAITTESGTPRAISLSLPPPLAKLFEGIVRSLSGCIFRNIYVLEGIYSMLYAHHMHTGVLDRSFAFRGLWLGASWRLSDNTTLRRGWPHRPIEYHETRVGSVITPIEFGRRHNTITGMRPTQIHGSSLR